MDGLAQVGRPKSMALNVKVSRFLAVSLKLPPLHITSPRPVVRFLSRGPDETGREDRWGILSQSQVPDPTGASVLSGLLHHDSAHCSSTGAHVLSQCVWPQIYCAEMQTDFPKEYVTLRSGQTDNYSEVYGHRCV